MVNLTEPAAEPKHLQIYGTTSRVIRQVDQLAALINEISPKPKSEEVAPTDGEITLSVFLATEGQRLEKIASRIEGLTDELRGLLF